VVQREHDVVHADEAPLVFLSSGQPASYALADGPAEFPVLPELAIQPRRRHFEIVPLLDETGGVQHVTHLAAGALTILHPDTVRLVDEHPQHPARPMPAPLEVYERQPVIAENGLQRLLDSDLAFVFLHATCKVKKWVRPTFSGL